MYFGWVFIFRRFEILILYTGHIARLDNEGPRVSFKNIEGRALQLKHSRGPTQVSNPQKNDSTRKQNKKRKTYPVPLSTSGGPWERTNRRHQFHTAPPAAQTKADAMAQSEWNCLSCPRPSHHVTLSLYDDYSYNSLPFSAVSFLLVLIVLYMCCLVFDCKCFLPLSFDVGCDYTAGTTPSIRPSFAKIKK